MPNSPEDIIKGILDQQMLRSSESLSVDIPSEGQVIKDASLLTLLAAMRVIVRSTGILQIETPYHKWKILMKTGGLVLMEEEGQVMQTLTRKFANAGMQFARLPEWDQKQSSKPYSYPFVTQVFKRYPEQTKVVLKEVLLESMLALHLEDKFSFMWRPINGLNSDLPVWQLPLLETKASSEAKQWQLFQCVKHPYQTVQLMDAANMLARVGNDNFPMFAKVTTGQHRICEIADSFKQPIYRSALLLDKLAQKKIVSILPIPERESESLSSTPSEIIRADTVAGKPSVFVVDDSPVLLRQFRDLLTSWGYQVNLTDDATNATQMILTHNPSVVFLDINMPGLNGFELIKQIRRQPSLATTPLVMVTAENSMTNSFRAKWASCKFIAKPRTSEDTDSFREQLRSLLREVAPLPSDVLV
jgi:CheY-like chemotaxis protein